MIHLFIPAVILFALVEPLYWIRTWAFPWWIFFMLAALLASWEIGKKYPSLIPITASVLASGAMLCAYPHSPYAGEFDMRVLLAIGHNAAYSVLSFLAIGLWASKVNEIWARRTFVIAALAMSLMVLVQAALGHDVAHRAEWFGNPSMVGCFIACVIPFMIQKPVDVFDSLFMLVMTAISVIAMAYLDASVPWLVLIAECLAFMVSAGRRHLLTPQAITFGFTVLLALLVGYKFVAGTEFASDTGRFAAWRFAIQHWMDAPITVKLFGFGLGSMQAIFPQWQAKGGFSPNNYFLWLHNDWLQTLVELGIAGLIGLLIAFLRALAGSWLRGNDSDHRWVSSLAGVAVFGFLNYPLRMPIPAMFVGFLLFAALRDARPKEVE